MRSDDRTQITEELVSSGMGPVGRWGILRRAILVVLMLLTSVALLAPAPTSAQDPSMTNASGKAASSFAKQPGGILGGPPQKIDRKQPLYLQADELDYDTRNNRVIARGNVEIYYNSYVLTADQVIYDQNVNSLTAQGNAQLKEPNGNIVRGDKIDTTADFRDAFIQSLSVIGKDDTRIAARRAVRKDGNVTEFEQGKFTPCKSDPGQPPLWCVSAQRIVHDQQAATISYTDAQFEIFGQPIAYLPYFEHADPSVKQRTGFLAPEFKHSSTLGWGTVIPYYFALSPNYDFTFRPEYLANQGVLFMGDWRHKVSTGDVRGEYLIKLAGIDQSASGLPSDTDPARKAQLEGFRGSVQTQGMFSLSSWWRFGWDVTIDSDDTFRRFYRLDSILQTERVNTAFLEGISDRNYFGMKFYQFGGLLVDQPLSTESRALPVIDYNYIYGKPVLDGELSFAANAVNLTRRSGTEMTRASIDANWRRKMIDGLGQTWTPFANVRADVTQFHNGFDPNDGSVLADETMSRAIGAVGVTYAYPWVANTATASHIIEPTAQIIARPASVSQRRLPDEDAKSLVWDDTLLFDTNKFSGWDRIETGTRANFGLQYTFQANTGGSIRVVAGQSIHLGGENAYADPGKVPYGVDGSLVTNFAPTSGLQRDKSDYVLGTYISPISNFRFVAQARFDEQELSLRRTDVFNSINLGLLQLSNQYSYRRNDADIDLFGSQQELISSATLKLTDRWSVTGTVRYDLDDKFLLSDILSVKYADECFVLTATYTESKYNNPLATIKPDQTIMLRFELKYLGEYTLKSPNLDTLMGTSQVPR